MSQSSLDDLKLFPNRRSKYVFIARGLTLMVTSGVLAIYGLGQLTKPTATAVTASSSLPPAIASPSPLPSATTPPSLLPFTTTLPIGVLAEDVQVVSQDGLALLKLPKGTRLLDAQGQPPASITVSARDLPLSYEIALVGMGYEFGPDGMALEPPSSLILSYDPKAYWPFSYQDVNCSQLHIAWVSSTGAPVVPWLKVSVDLNLHSVTTKIDHLGTLMLFCEVFRSPIS